MWETFIVGSLSDDPGSLYTRILCPLSLVCICAPVVSHFKWRTATSEVDSGMMLKKLARLTCIVMHLNAGEMRKH